MASIVKRIDADGDGNITIKEFLEGLTQADPEMFMRGLGKGAFALTKGSVGGALKFSAQVTASLGRSFA